MEKAVCLSQCSNRWCCTHQTFSAPPLCFREIRRIEKVVPYRFYDRKPPFSTLKVKADGYCIFFRKPEMRCGIYGIRPFDCRMFPFDFVTFGPAEGVWVMWDCPLSRSMTASEIDASLSYFERHFARQLFETWYFGNGDYDDIAAPVGYRRLRALRISPPFQSKPVWVSDRMFAGS